MQHSQQTPTVSLASRTRAFMQRLYSDQQGASFVEYVIVVGLVAVLCIAAFQKFGKAIEKQVDAQTKEISEMKK